jgi:hypothetical protein
MPLFLNLFLFFGDRFRRLIDSDGRLDDDGLLRPVLKYPNRANLD